MEIANKLAFEIFLQAITCLICSRKTKYFVCRIKIVGYSGQFQEIVIVTLFDFEGP